MRLSTAVRCLKFKNALLSGNEERRSSATPNSQQDFLQTLKPKGRKERSGSIKVPGSGMERRGSARRKKNKD